MPWYAFVRRDFAPKCVHRTFREAWKEGQGFAVREPEDFLTPYYRNRGFIDGQPRVRVGRAFHRSDRGGVFKLSPAINSPVDE